MLTVLFLIFVGGFLFYAQGFFSYADGSFFLRGGLAKVSVAAAKAERPFLSSSPFPSHSSLNLD